jgi:hypothetical protein
VVLILSGARLDGRWVRRQFCTGGPAVRGGQAYLVVRLT